MSDKERLEFIKALKEQTEKLSKNEKASKKFLVDWHYYGEGKSS